MLPKIVTKVENITFPSSVLPLEKKTAKIISQLKFQSIRASKICSRTKAYVGADPRFFRRGCTRLLFYFNTNKPHSFFFLQNTSCIKKPQFILWRGGAYPLHPPPRSGPGTGTFVFGRGGDLFARRNYKKLHSARVTDFCNRNTRALVFYEKGKTFTILTLNETVLILEVVILKSCILYNHY